jgi:hypothetical protein
MKPNASKASSGEGLLGPLMILAVVAVLALQHLHSSHLYALLFN